MNNLDRIEEYFPDNNSSSFVSGHESQGLDGLFNNNFESSFSDKSNYL